MQAITPATRRVHSTSGYLDLCTACYALLQVEGTLPSGSAREEPITLDGWTRTVPAPEGHACCQCDINAHRPVLRRPPARLGEFPMPWDPV